MRCPRCSNAMDAVVASTDGIPRRANHCFTCGFTKGVVGLRQMSGELGSLGTLVSGSSPRARAAHAAVAEARQFPGRSVITPPVLAIRQWLRALVGLSWRSREPRLVFRLNPDTGIVEFAAADAVPMPPSALRVSRWRLLFPVFTFE